MKCDARRGLGARFGVAAMTAVACSVVFAACGVWVTAQSGGKIGVDWRKMLPKVQEVVQTSTLKREVHGDVHAQIVKSGSVKGEAVALVNLGSSEGAYTDAVTVVRTENGAPVLAKFREKGGKVAADGEVFPSGSSVNHSVTVEIDEANGAVVTKSVGLNGPGTALESCELDAYRWDAGAGMFAWDAKLSAAMKAAFCAVERKRPSLLSSEPG